MNWHYIIATQPKPALTSDGFFATPPPFQQQPQQQQPVQAFGSGFDAFNNPKPTGNIHYFNSLYSL